MKYEKIPTHKKVGKLPYRYITNLEILNKMNILVEYKYIKVGVYTHKEV